MRRDITLDILRGIGILFVVFGHICHIYEVRVYIWGFHIPIFFFISGLLFNKAKYSGFFDYCKKKFRNLLLPYLFFYLITFIYWLLIERRFRGAEIVPLTQVLGMFYGTYSLKWMYFNGALWFIPCLFSMEILYWFVSNCRSCVLKVILLVIVYLIGILSIRFSPWLPFGLCAALVGLVFFGMGDWFKVYYKRTIEFGNENRLVLFSIVIALFILQLVLLPFTGADLAALQINNYWMYIPISTIGVSLFFFVSLIIRKNFVLEWLGRNSLVIFALQEPVYRMVIFIGTKITGMHTEVFRCDIICCVVSTAISVFLIFPFAICYNKRIHPAIIKV